MRANAFSLAATMKMFKKNGTTKDVNNLYLKSIWDLTPFGDLNTQDELCRADFIHFSLFFF